jgi:cell division protein FtsB
MFKRSAPILEQFAKVGSRKLSKVNLSLTAKSVEKFTSKAGNVFGRWVNKIARSDGSKAVSNQGGVRLDEQQDNQSMDPRQIWQFVRCLFYSARRKVATAGIGVLVLWLGFHVIFGANGMVVYQGKRAEFKKLQTDLQQVEEENQRLTKQVDELRNDPKAIEREAREQLHYTKKGEMVYLLPTPKKAEAPPANEAAQVKK